MWIIEKKSNNKNNLVWIKTRKIKQQETFTGHDRERFCQEHSGLFRHISDANVSSNNFHLTMNKFAVFYVEKEFL